MLAKILTKGKENSIKLMVEMTVTLEKACVTLSMGQVFSVLRDGYEVLVRKNSQILKMIKS